MMGGLFMPKHTVLGCDISGQVEAVGKDVTQFHPGDSVFGATLTGGFAEYACTVEARLALKPASITYEQAAAVPVAALTALQGLRDKGRIWPGQKVLVDGASGGVGTFAVQIAKAFGTEVTAVCSTRNTEQARMLGADHVIDYTQEDFTRSGRRYDLIFAANAWHSVMDYRRALRPDGIFVMAGGGLALYFHVLTLGSLLSWMGNKKYFSYVAKINQQDLEFLKELLDSGQVIPVIDRRYPLSDTAEAIRYLEEGHAQGKVVILPHQ
jgi:NADPH:quinone reductase-like Zn-dependent oxidoreductase